MNIILVYGGKSVEHDISIITALQCYDALNCLEHQVELVYLSQENEFFIGKALKKRKNYIDKKKLLNSLKKCEITNNYLKVKLKKIKIDCAVNCCHGGIGENGVLAGFLEKNNIKFTSANMPSSAICMNKAFTHKLLKDEVPVVEDMLISKQQYEKNNNEILNKIKIKFLAQCFVKPNNLGSSIGVAKCDIEKVGEQLDAIFMIDKEAIIEEVVENLVEVNCAVFRHGKRLVVSELEQPVNKHDYLSFEDKYMSNQKSKGMKGLDRIIPAKIEKNLKNSILKYVETAYEKLGLKGVVRIDFLIDSKNKKVYLNEINTIPGSLAFYLFEPKGIDYATMLQMLIKEAQNGNENEITYFKSDVLLK